MIKLRGLAGNKSRGCPGWCFGKSLQAFMLDALPTLVMHRCQFWLGFLMDGAFPGLEVVPLLDPGHSRGHRLKRHP